MTEALPQVTGSPDEDAAGTMVYPRYPLGDPARLAVSNGGLAVTVSAPTPFRLLAVHPSQPVLAASTWVRDLDLVRSQAQRAVRRGPTMVVGDLNSTWDTDCSATCSPRGCATRGKPRTPAGSRPGPA